MYIFNIIFIYKNSIKIARCIIELERIKEFRQRSAGKISLEQDNLTPKYSQSDMAEQLEMTRQQLQDYKN